MRSECLELTSSASLSAARAPCQDAWSLAESLASEQTLLSATRRYESSRREAVEPVLQKSRFIGWLETQSGSLGTLARDAALTAAGKLGVAEFIFVDGAVPRV